VRPIHQTVLPDEDNPLKGNCFAACLASVLELPLDDVPHVMHHEDWRERTNAWLASRGMGTIEVSLETEEPALYPVPPGMLVIVSGRTVRHPERLHAVVARTVAGGCQWEYLHDPHPAGGFLIQATHLMWVVPLDPAGLITRNQ
jgi:hypothetical protein